MPVGRFTESVVEDAALGWLKALDCQVLYGLDITSAKQPRSGATRTTSTWCWNRRKCCAGK